MGTGYSVPRRPLVSVKQRSVRRRVDRAACPHVFAPSAKQPRYRPNCHILQMMQIPTTQNRENMGTGYSVPRRPLVSVKQRSVRRRVDRAACPHVFAPSAKQPRYRPNCHILQMMQIPTTQNRENMGTDYSVPRRPLVSVKQRSLRRRVDRAACPHVFAPSAKQPRHRPNCHILQMM
jgi:hypothetical protein